jgi:hypothetical protein
MELVIVVQPSCCNLFRVNGSIRERLTDAQGHGAYAHCVSFAKGYVSAIGDRYNMEGFARLAFCRGTGDPASLSWEFTGTREMLEARA